MVTTCALTLTNLVLTMTRISGTLKLNALYVLLSLFQNRAIATAIDTLQSFAQLLELISMFADVYVLIRT